MTIEEIGEDEGHEKDKRWDDDSNHDYSSLLSLTALFPVGIKRQQESQKRKEISNSHSHNHIKALAHIIPPSGQFSQGLQDTFSA